MNVNSKQYNFLLLVVALVAFILTFHFYTQPIEPGLDSSWKYAYNRFFTDDIRSGRDVIGTYGPLGFLVNTMPLGSNLRIAFWFEVLIRLSLVLTFVFLFLGNRSISPRDRIIPGLMLLLLLLTVNRGEKTPGMELVALSAGLVITAYRKNSPVFLAGAVMLTALAFLIKFSIGILCLSFPAVYGLWMIVWQREIIKPAIWTCAPFLSAAVLWLMLYGDFQGLGDYLVGSLGQSWGYSSAMTSLNAPDAPGWIAAGLATLAFLVYTIRRERGLLFVFFLFIPGLLVSIKYGVTKQPQFLFHYAFLMLLLPAGQARTLARQASILAIMSLFMFFLNLNTGFLAADAFRFDTAEPVVKPVDLRTSFRQLIDFKGYEQDLLSESATLLDPARLGDRTLAMIGDSPVDTYPWEISFIPANDLNWRPRPAFQSYFTYTPWFDRKNDEFFRSDRAPAFLLWDIDRGDRLESIDRRYLLNDEPLTILQILGNYSILDVDRNAIIFKRRGTSGLRPPVVFAATGPLAWNTGVEVPFREDGIVRARLMFTRTLLGRVRRTVYRESPVFAEFLFDSGEAARCRIVLDNAVSGIWVNPFVVSLLRPRSAQRVVAMRIVNPDAAKGFFAPQFSVDWELIAFDGRPASPFLLRPR